MSWLNEAPNLVNIYHPRYQGSGGAHCTAMYLVTVTTGAAGPDAQVSWYWDGDGYNSAPHNPCSNDNFTPPSMSGQPCDEAVNPRATVPACSLSGVYLTVSPSSQEACPGEVVTYHATLQNYTGAAATVNISVSGNSWTVSAPATVGPVADSGIATFDITHTIDPAAAGGATDVPTITAVDQANAANTDSAAFTTTAGIAFWYTVASSSPSWLGAGYPCRGCTARNGSGQWNTYIIGDTDAIGGFWAYNHATNTWSQPAPSGLPADRWSPGWAYDSATNLCYMTGGANAPGGGTYNTAYVYDPVANAFTALPSFTSVRDFHSSWIGTIDGTKYLCIGGGAAGSSTFLSSTQCMNLGTSTWQAENTIMPAYSFGERWAAAEGLIAAGTGNQFWLAAGADVLGNLVTSAYYFDDADNAWHTGGDVPTAVYRTNGAVSGGDFYVIGGSTGGFTPSDLVQRNSGGTWETLDPMPHSRMDLVCGVGADDTIWVVDGYNTAVASDYVDYFEKCEGSGPAGSILIYADDYYHTSPNTYVDQALQRMGCTYTARYNGDFAGFESDLAGSTWDLVVFENDNYGVPETTLDALYAFANGGGKLAMNTWGMGNYPGHALWNLMGAAYSANVIDPPAPVYWWNASHPFFTTPNTVPEFTSLTSGRYGTYGQYVNPLAGFEALAGYTTPGPDANQAAIVVGNGGRTVFKAFLDGQNDADLNGNTIPDGVELWENILTTFGTCGGGGCAITLAPVTLPDATVGLAYSQTVTASGGTAPYTYEVTMGTLPPGLTLNTATGVLSGIPTSGGSYTFTITATDSAACTGTITYTINFDYNWNMSVVDDAGRASVCLNTDTGYYAWTALTGFGAGTYVGHSNVTFVNNCYYFMSNLPMSMNMKVNMSNNRASGAFIRSPMRERSIAIDSDITDNPSCP